MDSIWIWNPRSIWYHNVKNNNNNLAVLDDGCRIIMVLSLNDVFFCIFLGVIIYPKLILFQFTLYELWNGTITSSNSEFKFCHSTASPWSCHNLHHAIMVTTAAGFLLSNNSLLLFGSGIVELFRLLRWNWFWLLPLDHLLNPDTHSKPFRLSA